MEQLIGAVVGAVIVFAFASIFGFSCCPIFGPVIELASDFLGRAGLSWPTCFVFFGISWLFRISRDVTFFEVLFSLTDLNLFLDENCVL